LIYAASTGKSKATVEFEMDHESTSPLVMQVSGAASPERVPLIRMEVNGKKVYEGKPAGRNQDYQQTVIQVPADAVHQGKNKLSVENLETSGPLGMPPWYAIRWIGL